MANMISFTKNFHEFFFLNVCHFPNFDRSGPTNQFSDPYIFIRNIYPLFKEWICWFYFFDFLHFTSCSSCREEAPCVWPVIDRLSSRSQDSFCAGGVPIASSCQNRPISSKAYQMVINILINTTIDVLNVLNILDRYRRYGLGDERPARAGQTKCRFAKCAGYINLGCRYKEGIQCAAVICRSEPLHYA